MKLIHGDCLEIMKKIPDGKIDMILCDLPYGTTKAKWDTIIPFDLLWESYNRIIKDNGAIVLTASQPFTSSLIMSNPKMFRHTWVWDKKFAGNFANAKIQPMKVHEDVVVFSKKKVIYNPQMIDRDQPIKGGGMTDSGTTNYGNNSEFVALKKTYDQKYPISIISVPRKLGKGSLHPTEKPVDLFEYLIKTYTEEGGLVLDNCVGSGTTLVACQNTGRKGIGIELEKEYCEVSKQRLEENYNNIINSQ